ncbi:MAG: hypothetical protein O3C45_09445 [Bacteroidetes bacterium]|nr:hypothetical protein [Bacteroidota bacterium]MDA0875266.1 hypothetical protein [Bacteroidota bacterium]
MKRFLLLAAVVFLAALPSEAQNLGVALRAGTTGVGVQVGYGFHPRFNIRAHYSTFSHSRTETSTGEPDLRIDADAGVGALASFLDFHPFRNAFRLTAGAGQNALDVSATATPLESVCMGDEDGNGGCSGKSFSPQKLGNLTARISYPSAIHPYVGMGFGSLGNGKSLITFLFDIGAYYTGSPEIELYNDGLFSPTTDPENVQVLNDGLESFAWYPVVSLGIGIRL